MKQKKVLDMKQTSKVLVILLTVCMIASAIPLNVYALQVDFSKLTGNTVYRGDNSEDYDEIERIVKKYAERNKQKEYMLKLYTLENEAASINKYKILSVPVFEQINDYYCGPATMKQVVHYIRGSSQTQQYYAIKLGTTLNGTSMTNIPSVLNSEALTPNWYVYYTFNSFGDWSAKIDSSIYYAYPAILDINTENVSAFPYNAEGHYVNVSGYDVYENISTQRYNIRITDPWGPGLGNRWYTAADIYQANNNHWRKAIVW